MSDVFADPSKDACDADIIRHAYTVDVAYRDYSLCIPRPSNHRVLCGRNVMLIQVLRCSR